MNKNIAPIALFGFLFFLLIRSFPLSLQNSELFDDSYMALRYAYNLAIHGEYTWNSGERSFGCTSVFNTFFLSIFYFFGIDKYFSGKAILLFNTHIWICLSMILWYRSAILIAKTDSKNSENTQNENDFENRKTLNLWFLSAGVFSILHLLQANMVNGMDTCLGIFGNTLLIYTLLEFRGKPTIFKLFLGAIAAYLTFLMRPDSGIYSALFPILFFYAIKTPFKQIFLFYILWIFLFSLDSFVKYEYFGYIFPLPFYVKKAGFYEGFLGWDLWKTHIFAQNFLLALLPSIIAICLFLQRKYWKLAAAFCLPFCLTLLYFSSVFQIMGGNSRYYMASLPFMLLGGLVLVDGFSKKINTKNLVLLCFAALSFHVFIRFTTAYFAKQEKSANEVAAQYPQSKYGHFFQKSHKEWYKSLEVYSKIIQKLPSTAVVAGSEYGLASCENKQTKIMDWAGLHNEDMAFGRGIGFTLQRYKPDFIWMPHHHYSKQYAMICENEYFKTNYDFYPNTLLYGIAIRKNSVYKTMIINTLKQNDTVFWGEISNDDY